MLNSARRTIIALLTAVATVVSIAGCDALGDEDESEPVEITLLVAYAPSVADSLDDIRGYVENALVETNQVYGNSNVDLRLELVHLAAVDYEATERLQDLERLMRDGDEHLDELHELRDEHEADVVALLLSERASTINGAVMADPSTAFVIIFWETLGAPDYALAHELGHLQGARHSPEADSRLEPFPYGHGFRNDSVKTIMSTGRLEVLPYFSSPDLAVDGVVLGDSSLRDVARVLRETAAYISNFRGPQTETDFVPPSTWPVIPPGASEAGGGARVGASATGD